MKCQCPICKQTRRIREIISKLPKPDAKWLEDFYNYHLEIGEEGEWYKHKFDELMKCKNLSQIKGI